MGKRVQSLLFAGLTAGSSLVASGCGDRQDSADNLTVAERQEAIRELNVQLGVAETALRSVQIDYERYLMGIPAECRGAIDPYVPPAGTKLDVSTDDAQKIVSDECLPDFPHVISDARGMYDVITKPQEVVTNLGNEIKIHLAILGVPPPTTLQ